jgi:N,N'-diacetyllegionaminate synthase
MKPNVTIQGRRIGNSSPMFIVAEAGINHNGDMRFAKELIVKAKEVGADAIKFQGFTAELLCDLKLTETKDVKALTGGTKSSYEMYKRLELSHTNLRTLFEFSKKQGIIFFASVFDEKKVDFLASLKVPCFKISSGDLTHIPLLCHTARKKRPVIISTGMGTLEEVQKAVAACEREGLYELVLLHCTADYPPRDEEVNLSVLSTLKKSFDCPIGYSDHTVGLEIPFAACALGAAMIEKHFTLDKNMDGPDQKLSLDPVEFKAMVDGIRKIERARGNGVKEPSRKERGLLICSRRGIKAARAIKKGETITTNKLKVVKPASGLKPEFFDSLVGKIATRDLAYNEPIEKECVKSKN